MKVRSHAPAERSCEMKGLPAKDRDVAATAQGEDMPGRAFAFARTEPFGGTVQWSYRFEPDGNGTTVTESYEVTRPMGRIGWFIIGTLFGRSDRRSDLRTGMEQTLQRIRDTAERSTKKTSEGTL